MTHREPMLTSR